MSKKNSHVDMSGLQFFGIFSASISHEIKNALAIINENAGLLEDLIGLAQQGTPLDPVRLKKLAGSISGQIRRADGIVKNMNQFAHSVDESHNTVDLNEIIELFVALSGRFAAMRSVTLELKMPAGPVMLTTTPFFLMNLLWLCLDFAMDATGDEKIVELAAEKTENGASVRFRRLGGLGQVPMDTFPAEREKTLLGVLEAELTADTGTKEITLKISGDSYQ